MSRLRIAFSLFILTLLIAGTFVGTVLVKRPQQLKSFAAGFTPTTTTPGSLYQSQDLNGDGISDDVINVMAFGARGDGKTDDTYAINTAIAASQVGDQARNPHTVYFPNGFYKVGSINATKKQIKLQGESMQGVWLMGNAQDVYGGPAFPVLDLTGAQYIEVENFTIIGGLSDFKGTPSGVYPTAGILIAPTQELGAGGTKYLLRNLMIKGRFTKASLYIYGTCCNSYSNVYADSYLDGVPALMMTAHNISNIASHWANIGIGWQDLVDHNFSESEFHDVSNIITGDFPQGYDPTRGARNTGSTKTVVIENGAGITFTGGVISTCGGPASVSLSESNSVTFTGTSFVGNQETTTCAPSRNKIYGSGQIRALTLTGTNISGGGLSGGIIGGSSDGVVFTGLTMWGDFRQRAPYGPTNAYPPSPYKIIDIETQHSPSATTVVNSIFQASGLDISPGGSIDHSFIMQPGQMILPPGASDTSQKL